MNDIVFNPKTLTICLPMFCRLTAYVSKIFAYASEFSDGVPNQPKTLKVMICESLTYITNRQRSDGAFADPLGIFFSETVAVSFRRTLDI